MATKDETEVLAKLTDLLKNIESTLGSITDRSNELNDSSKDRDIASVNERDQTTRTSTVDLSQDVDSQERIKTDAVSYDLAKRQADLENQRRDRSQFDSLSGSGQRAVDQAVKLQDELNQSYATAFAAMVTNLAQNINQQQANLINAAEMAKNQDRRHVDHTMVDLHGSDVNPGAAPNAQPTQDGTK